VIHEPVSDGVGQADRYSYNQEQLLVVGNWYHRTAEEVQASYLTYMSSGHEVIHRSKSLCLCKCGRELKPVPDSILINGLGMFDCAMAVPSRPIECKDVQSPRIVLET
jgi:hypothetical protein